MRSIEDVVRRRSERGQHRDPQEVLAAVHREVAASEQGDPPLAAATQPRLRSLEDPLVTTADPHYAPPEVAHRRRPYRRLLGAAAALLVAGLTGSLATQIQTSEVEAPVATEPELPPPPTEVPRETPADPLPSLDRYLPTEPVPAVEILRLEGRYSLHAAWDSHSLHTARDPHFCISLRDEGAEGPGYPGASVCGPPESLGATLLGFSSHVDDPGYFISGAVGPEITQVRATIAESGDQIIPVVGHPAFEDIQFFLLYIAAPDERLEDLRTITRDGTEHPVMDVDTLARRADRIEELLAEPWPGES